MATATGDAYSERTLFARKATGLVRGWAVRDAFIYATFSINLITLGLFIFSYAVFVPNGNLLWAVVLSGAYLLLQVITYASLISAMPRAGGDYVWISRILGGGIGFVLAATGWWFILWHWVPIYANILNVEVFVPLGAIVAGADSGWVSFFSEPKGLFWSSIIVALLASTIIALGMRTYARIQKLCFYGGLVGLLFMLVLLLVNSKSDFISAFNSQGVEKLGVPENGYQATVDAAAVGEPALGSFGAGQGLFLLIPFVLFFNLWSNWGATLYGEVRGASDFWKNARAMGGALLFTTIAAVIMFALFAKTFGWDFYNAANNSYWGQEALYNYVPDAPVTYFPYPGLLASFLMDGALWQFILIALLALWFFGWVGTVFLSSTRVVFATAFDRVLPETAAKVSRNGVPWVALLLMLIPSIPIAYFYAYDADGFQTWTLGATLVIAITFLGSAVGAAILPWRRPEVYRASPIARYGVAGVPLITLAAVGFMAILGFCLYKWFTDELYGLNNRDSLIYLGSLYVLALAIYAVSWFVRRRQGTSLKMVHGEIPAE
jgi:APA family basic amino acid/polyamine antiporter